MKLFHRLTPLGLVLVASASLIAQEVTGTLVGTVRGDGGKVLVGARISVSSPNLLQTRVIIANDKGEFRVPLLPPSNNYTVMVTADGYVSRKADGIYVPAGGTIRQDLNLKSIASAGASVEVVAVSSSVDKTETKTATTFSEEALQNLPTGSFNSYGALAVSPGVSGSVTYPVIRGGITGESQFLINGISVRDPLVRQGRQFEKAIDDLTQDVQVILSPMNAKYGFTSAGITNIVTKRGSNEFEGSLRVKLRNPAWAAGVHELKARPDNAYYSNQQVITSYTAPVEDATARTYEVTFLGPIWKDHLTFAYAGRFRPPALSTATLTNLFSSSVLASFVPYPAAGTTAHTFGQVDVTPMVLSGVQQTLTQQYKLFWQINKDQTLSWEATVDKLGPQYFDGQFGGIDPLQARFQTSDRGTRGVSYNAILGSSTVVDIKWGTNKSEVQFSKGPGDPIYVGYYRSNATSIWDTSATSKYYGALLTNGDPAKDTEKRNSQTIDANIQHIWGNHTFDLGFGELKEITWAGGYPGMNGLTYYTPGMTAVNSYVVYNVAGDPRADPNLNTSSTALWRTAGRVPAVIKASTSTAGKPPENTDTSQGIYLNDLYTLNNNWSFMGGLRAEKYIVDNRSGRMVSSSSILPRLTAKYDLYGNNKHVFDLNYGQFRGTIGQGNMGGNFTRRPNNQSITQYWNQGPVYASATPTAGAYLVSQATLLNLANYKTYSWSDADLLYDLDPNLKPENRESITLNYKRAFTGGFFRVSAIFDKFKDLWYAKADPGLPNVEIKDFTGAGLPSRLGYHQILTTDPHGKRDYRSLEFEWQQELSKGDRHLVQWNGNWTMSRTRSTQTWREGNVGSSAPIWYEQWQAAGVPMDAYNPYGELSGVSQHHNIKTWLTFQIGSPKGVQNTLTLLGSYFSGYPYSLTQSMSAPPDVLAHTSQLQTVGTSTSASYFINGARGQFLAQDSPTTIDLQWNMTIPIRGKLQAFTQVTIYNVFNHFNRTALQSKMSAIGDTTTSTGASWVYPNLPPSYRAFWYSQLYYPFGGYASGDFTYNSGTRNARNFGLDMGFRF